MPFVLSADGSLPLRELMAIPKQKTNSIESSPDIEFNMRVKAESGPILLFYQFSCPHCGELNVYAKNCKKEVVLCSATGCRKIIIIENYKDIA